MRGPAQNNLDLALGKAFPFSLRNEHANVDFRVESFNTLNTPQFGDPVQNQDAANFGVINTQVVSSRILQLALKVGF